MTMALDRIVRTMMAAAEQMPRRHFRPSPAATVFTALGLALLVALGVWQVQRLQWKTALIDEIAARSRIPSAPAGSWGDLEPLDQWTWRRVRVRGILDHSRSLYVAHGRGYDVVTPLVRRNGRPLLVVRGHVRKPDSYDPVPKDALALGPQEFTAVVRPPRGKGWFTPDNDSKANRWYWEDIPAMARAAGIQDPVPAILVATASLGPPPLEPVEARPSLPNNHLGYAFTWFALALVLMVVYLRHGLERGRQQADGRSSRR